MVQGLEALANMEYPGRFIIGGRDTSGVNNTVVYGITGRSPSSKARKLQRDEQAGVIRTEVTDPKQLEQGNPALLIYPAIAIIDDTVLVSNGAQTNLLYSAYFNGKKIPELILNRAHSEPSFIYDQKLGWVDITSYETDSNFTPRISACIREDSAAFYIVRKGENAERKSHLYSIDLVAGKGKLLATYTGVNTDPLPSFTAEPLDVKLEGRTSQETAEIVYAALAPKAPAENDPTKDFRVGVAAVYYNIESRQMSMAIINRHELGGN